MLSVHSATAVLIQDLHIDRLVLLRLLHIVIACGECVALPMEANMMDCRRIGWR